MFLEDKLLLRFYFCITHGRKEDCIGQDQKIPYIFIKGINITHP